MFNVFKSERRDDLWKAIIRPPKYSYKETDLGQKELLLYNKIPLVRTDVELMNKRNFKIKCSHWEIKEIKSEYCVVYLHGNSSSRFEALQLIPLLIPSFITVFAFDFSGCGLSEGEYISLGWHEKDDVELIINHLKKEKKIEKIVLWGRSMGSSAAILYSSLNNKNDIMGMVLDSPFCSLREVAEDIAKKNSKIPRCIMKIVWFFLKRKIQKKAHFNINDIVPVNHVKKVNQPPAFFICSKNDKMVNPSQMEHIFQEYKGVKIFEKVEGDHNSSRPQNSLKKCIKFIKKVFANEEILEEDLDEEKGPKRTRVISNVIPTKKIDIDENIEDEDMKK